MPRRSRSFSIGAADLDFQQLCDQLHDSDILHATHQLLMQAAKFLNSRLKSAAPSLPMLYRLLCHGDFHWKLLSGVWRGWRFQKYLNLQTYVSRRDLAIAARVRLVVIEVAGHITGYWHLTTHGLWIVFKRWFEYSELAVSIGGTAARSPVIWESRVGEENMRICLPVILFCCSDFLWSWSIRFSYYGDGHGILFLHIDLLRFVAREQKK